MDNDLLFYWKFKCVPHKADNYVNVFKSTRLFNEALGRAFHIQTITIIPCLYMSIVNFFINSLKYILIIFTSLPQFLPNLLLLIYPHSQFVFLGFF